MGTRWRFLLVVEVGGWWFSYVLVVGDCVFFVLAITSVLDMVLRYFYLQA